MHQDRPGRHFSGGETIHSLNLALAERMLAHRKALKASPAEIRKLVSERLHLASTRGAPTANEIGSVARTGYRIDKLTFETEPGIVVPALLFVPEKAHTRTAATILLDPRGKLVAAQNSEVESLVRQGRIVFIPDLRGWASPLRPKVRAATPGTGRWPCALCWSAKTCPACRPTMRFALRLPRGPSRRKSRAYHHSRRRRRRANRALFRCC